MDLRWLTAPDADVAAALVTARRGSRPGWVPNRRRILVHVNQCLLLWYVCIVLMTYGIQVDEFQHNDIVPENVPGMLVTGLIFVVWAAGSVLLWRWSMRPPGSRARILQGRQELTALANGFEPEPKSYSTFPTLLSAAGRIREFPRFSAPGVEFGTLLAGTRRARGWRYLAVKLPAPLPHLILDAAPHDGLDGDLPQGVDQGQRFSLEGDFDRWFRVYTPAGYGKDALYVLTPDVMADLLDHARGFNVEILDDTIVFFTEPAADYSQAEAWERVDALLTTVVARIATSAGRYLDVRVPGQDTSRLLDRLTAERERPGIPYLPPAPRIGSDGRRLEMRAGRRAARWLIGAIGWYTLLFVLYFVPAVFAFAGFMSIVDGR